MEWYIPALIFVARIIDVSIGTVRIIFVISGRAWIASVLGFFEVLVWAIAVGNMVKFLDHWPALLGYAGGFAAGTLAGLAIERRLAVGLRLIRVINPDISANVAANLRDEGYRVTRVEGTGRDGPVELSFTVVKRRRAEAVVALVRSISPRAFITVERADSAEGGSFTGDASVRRMRFARAFGVRK